MTEIFDRNFLFANRVLGLGPGACGLGPWGLRGLGGLGGPGAGARLRLVPLLTSSKVHFDCGIGLLGMVAQKRAHLGSENVSKNGSGSDNVQLHFDFGIVLLGRAGVGLKILEKLVYQEACSVISQLQVHLDFKIGLLSRAGGVIVVTNKDKQFLFITFLRV